MNQTRRSISIGICLLALVTLACSEKPPVYGVERQLYLPGDRAQVWAVAPAVNLSGIGDVDPLLQADLIYQQVQTVNGVRAIPVNRVVDVYAAMQIGGIGSAEQASAVCELLAADALLVPTITAYDPYNPPKLGASLQLFWRSPDYRRPTGVEVRELSRMAAPAAGESLPATPPDLFQVVGMYDAASGSVREKLALYADGRNDPVGPLGAREYLVSMDRYCGFVYHDLVEQLLLKLQRVPGR